MDKIFSKPKCMTDKPFHYCPGCGHGIAHRLVGEVIDELGIKEKAIGVAPVGCSVFAYWYYDIDFSQAAHGRAPAVATGMKRARPENIIFTYQGDGDLAASGTAEIVHAAARGENITVVFINNAIYGMTGGQMAPTTIIGQKTQTTPLGRNAAANGFPINMSEMLATLEGPSYIERTALNNSGNIIKTKKAIKKAFERQINGKGFSMIEILSTCPTNWGMTAPKAMEWLKDNLIPQYPLGVFKDKEVDNG